MMDIEKKIDAIRGGHLHVIASLTIGENMDICKRLRNAEAENEQLRQRIADSPEHDPKDLLDAEKLALKFCDSRSIKHGTDLWIKIVDAFTSGYRMRPIPQVTGHVEHNLNMVPRITEQEALPDGYCEEWKHNVMRLWSCVRKHDSSIPSDVLDYIRDDLLNKLNADREQVPAVSAPDGWKLVPVTITDAMVDASGCEGQYKLSAHEQAQRLWSEMLAAAPSNSQQSAPRLKDHQIAEVINAVRDVAETYSGTQQLRERIAGVLRPALCSYGNRCPSHESEQGGGSV